MPQRIMWRKDKIEVPQSFLKPGHLWGNDWVNTIQSGHCSCFCVQYIQKSWGATHHCHIYIYIWLCYIYICHIFVYIYISYLKELQIEWIRIRERERVCVCCFSPQMIITAGAGPGWIQEPGASFRSPTWVLTPKDLGHLIQLSYVALQLRLELMLFWVLAWCQGTA